MADGARVEIEGLRAFRRDLKAMDAGAPKLLQHEVMKPSAEAVVAEARRRAPRRSGRLAASLKVGTKGDRVLIRSPLPYANPIHWGWPSRGIRGRPFLTSAVAAKLDEVERQMTEAFDDFARRHGFR